MTHFAVVELLSSLFYLRNIVHEIRKLEYIIFTLKRGAYTRLKCMPSSLDPFQYLTVDCSLWIGVYGIFFCFAIRLGFRTIAYSSLYSLYDFVHVYYDHSGCVGAIV